MFKTTDKPIDYEIQSVIMFLTIRNAATAEVQQISEVYGLNAMGDNKVRK